MSRSGYSDDIDNWQLIKWRGMVASAIRGKRGQKFFSDLVAALDAMPVKALIAKELKAEDGVCALGSLGDARQIDMSNIDPEDYSAVAIAFGIAECLAQETVFINDEAGRRDETPEQRWARVRAWAVKNQNGKV